MAIKDALRVGLILATVSSLGAVLYDWKNLKTKRDDGNDERRSDCELGQIAEGRTGDEVKYILI